MTSGLSSFISKYTIQEKVHEPHHYNEGITVEQYFVEMEKRQALALAHHHAMNGKRCISTAAPASRQHYQQYREHSGDNKEKVAHEYSLGPIQLTKGSYQPSGNQINGNNKLPNPLRLSKETRPELTASDKVKLDQQSYHQRPDSRYNQESLCLSLDGVQRSIRVPAMTSWGKERKEGVKKFPKNIEGLGKFMPTGVLKTYGQY